ncbi:hypothetical protein FCV44_02640 [Vibrio kanaloae]|uniref:hypothetical protein n=1 Tax=Vibrio kanaloae TaxID=170673 RepID=UPI0010BF0275|nr:hypothetical protein [Vibrio kanaloae]TKF00568.1 hypothetical protein FCV44_02640 [Vibrio kanaloae]TKF20101.1 hypothetical protein FCV47_01325 [Vibrio kanaloae]
MKQFKVLISLGLSLCVILFLPLAQASSSNIESASINSCNVKGNLSISILGGITNNVPISCVNRTERESVGINEQSVTGDVDVDAGPMLNVAHLEAPHGTSLYQESDNTTSFIGLTEVENIEFVQGQITAEGVAGGIFIEDKSDSELGLAAVAEIAYLTINGEPQTLPYPIPKNYSLYVGNIILDVNVAGIGLVSVPVNGEVTLNRVSITESSPNETKIEHSPIHIELNGEVKLLNSELVKIDLVIDDYVNFKSKSRELYAVVNELEMEKFEMQKKIEEFIGMEAK